MATWSTSVVRTITHRWTVPTPNNGQQMYQAMSIADQERRRILGIPADVPGYDTDLTITTEDDMVVISFSVNEAT